MDLFPIEATNGVNWGKFGVGRFSPQEWSWPSALPETSQGHPLLAQVGWSPQHLWVLDLQTGEGALFCPPGSARADLEAHRIWVCPLFEPFLAWLYRQDLGDLSALPKLVELKDAEVRLYGHRHHGPRND